ncbi:hypothetical protein FGADI_11327 [Fusarium gaditjirri]|uniref:NADP-dependent oxidoreductase domain-containing protein n=1 Tax=Fusarium gaditjirri TaxID=282569 RepID=A0A8H4WQK7_9HYPO|nr:hypothetical protein FGADI_11327 [Fusarium gaditjirri]
MGSSSSKQKASFGSNPYTPVSGGNQWNYNNNTQFNHGYTMREKKHFKHGYSLRDFPQPQASFVSSPPSPVSGGSEWSYNSNTQSNQGEQKKHFKHGYTLRDSPQPKASLRNSFGSSPWNPVTGGRNQWSSNNNTHFNHGYTMRGNQKKHFKQGYTLRDPPKKRRCATSLRRTHSVYPITTVQMGYSPFSLQIEVPQFKLLKTARKLSVAVVACSPLSRGIFVPGFRSYLLRFNIAIAKDGTASQLTLAWLLAQGDQIYPIPRTTRPEPLVENLASCKVELSGEENAAARKEVERAEFTTWTYLLTSKVKVSIVKRRAKLRHIRAEPSMDEQHVQGQQPKECLEVQDEKRLQLQSFSKNQLNAEDSAMDDQVFEEQSGRDMATIFYSQEKQIENLHKTVISLRSNILTLNQELQNALHDTKTMTYAVNELQSQILQLKQPKISMTTPRSIIVNKLLNPPLSTAKDSHPSMPIQSQMAKDLKGALDRAMSAHEALYIYTKFENWLGPEVLQSVTLVTCCVCHKVKFKQAVGFSKPRPLNEFIERDLRLGCEKPLMQTLYFVEPRLTSKAREVAARLHFKMIKNGLMHSPFDQRYSRPTPSEVGPPLKADFSHVELYNIDEGRKTLQVPIFTQLLRVEKTPIDCVICNESIYNVSYDAVDEWIEVCVEFDGDWRHAGSVLYNLEVQMRAEARTPTADSTDLRRYQYAPRISPAPDLSSHPDTNDRERG